MLGEVRLLNLLIGLFVEFNPPVHGQISAVDYDSLGFHGVGLVCLNNSDGLGENLG